MAEERIKRQKRQSKGFADLGIPVGATLTFRKDPAVTCKTVDGKSKVEYLGKTYSISGLAKELMKTPISGYHAFKYNGVLLAKLDGAKADSAPPIAQASVKPVETAQTAPQTPVSPAPQTVPLPRPQEAATGYLAAPGAGEPPLDPLTGLPPEEDDA